MAEDQIILKHVTKRFTTKTLGTVTAVNDFNLNIHEGECFSFLGPSGCGKTTTLRMIAGFEDLSEGEIHLCGRPVSIKEKNLYVPPERRGLGMVFQAFAVWPHMNIFDNVAFPLQIKKVPHDEIRKRVKEALHHTSLDGMEEVYPSDLSGGQQQRIALARAIVTNPKVMLLDEPLSNLDPKLRESMRFEIKALQRKFGFTVIFVTHDQSEAMAISDKIIIMDKGVVAQMGTPQEIYYHPVNEFVADFIGEANFLRGPFVGKEGKYGILDIEGYKTKVEYNDKMKTGETYTVVLRPEAAGLADEGGLPCKVVLSCFMGSYQNYHVKVGNTLVKLEEKNPKNKKIYNVGDECHLVFEAESVHVL